MLIHPEDPELFLVELADSDSQSEHELFKSHREAIEEIIAWGREYLAKAHEDLGRDGPVCPYVQASMQRGSFYLTVRRGRDMSVEDVEATQLALREWFLELEPRAGQLSIFKTILCLYPDLGKEDYPRLIDAVQDKLRPEYVRDGLMIGEFHDAPPDKAGLWNLDFRPLNSPIPMLVTRHMVPTDLAFLKGEKNLLQMYLERFGTRVPEYLRAEVAEACRGFNLYFPDPRELEAVHHRVRRALEEHQAPFTVHRHTDLDRPIRGPQDFADALGYDLGRITKSLFLRGRDQRYVVAVCAADRKIDMGRLAQEVGETRLELATREELAALLDFSPGGVSPIGIQVRVPVFLDEALFDYPTILVAAGEVAVEVEVAPDDLVRISEARVLRLTEAPERVEA